MRMLTGLGIAVLAMIAVRAGESPADLMRRAGETPEGCFVSKGIYGESLEIMITPEEDSRGYYFLYEIAAEDLGVAILASSGIKDDDTDIVMIDKAADGLIDYSKGPRSGKGTQVEYRKALKVLEKTIDDCQPAKVSAG